MSGDRFMSSGMCIVVSIVFVNLWHGLVDLFTIIQCQSAGSLDNFLVYDTYPPSFVLMP